MLWLGHLHHWFGCPLLLLACSSVAAVSLLNKLKANPTFIYSESPDCTHAPFKWGASLCASPSTTCQANQGLTKMVQPGSFSFSARYSGSVVSFLCIRWLHKFLLSKCGTSGIKKKLSAGVTHMKFSACCASQLQFRTTSKETGCLPPCLLQRANGCLLFRTLWSRSQWPDSLSLHERNCLWGGALQPVSIGCCIHQAWTQLHVFQGIHQAMCRRLGVASVLQILFQRMH